MTCGGPSRQASEQPFDFLDREPILLSQFRIGQARSHTRHQQLESHVAERGASRRDLRHDLTTFPSVREHLLHAPDLPFGATKALLEILQYVIGQIHGVPSGVSRHLKRCQYPQRYRPLPPNGCLT